MSDVEIGGFSIIRRLGSGGYGEIYAAQKPNDSTIYAIKTETVETNQKGMELEISVLRELPPSTRFSKLITHGSTPALNYFVMPLYGPSLSALKKLMPSGRFNLYTAFYVAKQMLEILQELHSTGFVHCDVKPSNFLLQQRTIGGLVLIDFGLSSKYITSEGKHIESRTSSGFRGTLKYASLNVHKLFEPTRRDDVISWFYSLIEMSKGTLPWADVRDRNLSMSCKQTISPEKLCQGLPEKVVEIWKCIKDLKFDEEPDYELIYQYIDEIFGENQWSQINLLDWETNPNLLKETTPFPELFDKTNDDVIEGFYAGDQDDITCCCRV